MSQLAIFLIRAYQILISPFLHAAFGPTAGCRYEISCSEYAIHSLRTKGFFIGGWRSMLRVSHCI